MRYNPGFLSTACALIEFRQVAAQPPPTAVLQVRQRAEEPDCDATAQLVLQLVVTSVTLIIDAKKGWLLPDKDQLNKYLPPGPGMRRPAPIEE